MSITTAECSFANSVSFAHIAENVRELAARAPTTSYWSAGSHLILPYKSLPKFSSAWKGFLDISCQLVDLSWLVHYGRVIWSVVREGCPLSALGLRLRKIFTPDSDGEIQYFLATTHFLEINYQLQLMNRQRFWNKKFSKSEHSEPPAGKWEVSEKTVW